MWTGGVLCGNGGHTSPPLPQSKQSPLGTESWSPSPGIAWFWHHSRPYKARYRVRMPAMELELRYCRGSLQPGHVSLAQTLWQEALWWIRTHPWLFTKCWTAFVPLESSLLHIEQVAYKSNFTENSWVSAFLCVMVERQQLLEVRIIHLQTHNLGPSLHQQPDDRYPNTSFYFNILLAVEWGSTLQHTECVLMIRLDGRRGHVF